MGIRWIAALAMAAALTGCSKSEDIRERSDDLATPQARVAPPGAVTTADSAPDIAITAAPGVAFNYRYAFRLPPERIGAVQERHAQACEALGVARCRITGLLYRLVDERDVEASLAFKLEPRLARAFGKAGVAEVAKADGMLVESQITGEDAGQAIDDANRSERNLAGELADLQRQLVAMGARDAGRPALLDQIDRLRAAIRGTVDTRAANRASLASTPVVFSYGSGRLVPGFDTRSPVRSALEQAWSNIVTGFGAMILIVGTLLPWILLFLLLAFLVRLVRPHVRRWIGPAGEG